MPQLSPRVAEIRRQQRAGEETVQRLEHELACANQERSFLAAAHDAATKTHEHVAVPDMRSNLDAMQLLLQRLDRYRKLLKAFGGYVKTVVCKECKGTGKILREGESEYKKCSGCSGTGIVE